MALTKVTTHVIADDIALGGNPTTTTQSTGNDTTRIATTAFVQTELASLVDSAPSTLNTLNELAAALGDDANFSTTVTNSIAAKLPLAGGTMTGALNMGSQNITSANRITLADGVVDSGQAGSSTVFNDDGTTADFRIESDSNTHMFFLDGGLNRIGVNTSGPNGVLHIGSSAAVGDASNPAIQIGGTTTYRGGLYTTSEGFIIDNNNGDDGIQLHTKTAGEAVRITSDGNLELKAKTTSFVSPGFTYHTNNYLYLRGGSAGTIISDDSGINTVQIIDGSSGYINFETGDGTSRMRIKHDGKVGIGTTSPSSMLQVIGNIQSADGSGGSATFSSTGSIELKRSGGSFIDFATSTSEDFDCRIKQDSDGLRFTTGGNGSTALGMTIDSSQQVGIGTSSPSATLDVRTDQDPASGLISFIRNDTVNGNGAFYGIDVNNVGNWSFGIPDNSDAFVIVDGEGNSGQEKFRITSGGHVNIGQFNNSTHMLYLASTGDAGIHIRADSDNSGENDNPYISMAQDGGNTQQFKLGMAGDANTAFNMQLANSPFVHANNANSQPLQFAHMTDMAVTISNVPTLAATGQSATDPRDFDSNGSLSGSAVGGMKIHKYGNNTAAALMLSGHNNTGTPGTETRTQLTHDGANLKFHIEHHGYESFNISPVGNIYLKNCTTVPSFTTSYNVSALSLKGGSIMNFEDSNFYVLQNLHYDGAWKNTYSGAGSMFSQNGGNGRYYYFDDPGSAGQSVSLINSVQFSNQSSASGLSYGNRPGHQGQLIIWGPSHATQKGGIEFHTSGGGGGGYGGRITCSDVGHVRILTRNNSSVWSEKFTVSGTSNEAQASNFGTGGYYRSSGPGGGAGIKMMGLAAGSGNNAVDTGISINASNGGRTMLVLGSRNTGAGDSTQSYLWLLRFKYDGNNLPQEFNINGNSSFWSVSKSGSNTLVLNGNSGNWQFGGIWVN